MPHNEHSFNRVNKYPGSHLEKTLFWCVCNAFFTSAAFTVDMCLCFSAHIPLLECRLLRLKNLQRSTINRKIVLAHSTKYYAQDGISIAHTVA